MAVAEEVEIDHETLVATANDLRRVSEKLAAATDSVAAAGLNGRSFGLMNSWMVPAVLAVADRSSELIALSSTVTDAFATATDAAAADWDEAEQAMITAIDSVGSSLDESTP